MSSTPSAHPAVKLTVTVVDGRVHPVVTNCMEPVVTSRVHVWPASSESVRVPGSGHAVENAGSGREGESARRARRVREVDVVGGVDAVGPFPGPLAGAEVDPLEHAVERPRATRRSGAVEAHRGGVRGRRAPVTDEHVARSVSVPGHEIRGGRVEGYEAAV